MKKEKAPTKLKPIRVTQAKVKTNIYSIPKQKFSHRNHTSWMRNHKSPVMLCQKRTMITSFS